MRKGVRLIKRLVALSLVLLLSIESFAAVVGDNDGAAFITKAEFDSLKSSFQGQINRYNQSIDNKIDGAIAGYLAGINSLKTRKENFYNGLGQKVLVADMSKINDLTWGIIGLDIAIGAQNLNNNGGKSDSSQASLSYKMRRTNTSPFEIFLYDTSTKKIRGYSYDYELTFIATQFIARSGYWTIHEALKINPVLVRWHAGYDGIGQGGGGAIKSNYNDDEWRDRPNYSTYLNNPNWLYTYCSGINLGMGWSNSPFWQSYDKSLQIDNETLIYNIMDDCNTRKKNKLWTPLDNNGITPNLKSLNSDYNSDSTKFAINYNKSGRQLQYTLPSDAGVVLSDAMVHTWNGTAASGTYFKNNVSSTIQWASYGTNKSSSTSHSNTSNKWWEIYFENEEEYSDELKNPSLNDDLLENYASYGYSGTIDQGLPIAIFNEDSTCEFEMTFDNNMVVGFKTLPFGLGTFVRDEVNDTDLTVYIDGAKMLQTNNEVSQGKHKFKIEYKKNIKGPIFIKFGRVAADADTSNRYLVSLPKNFNMTE